MPHDEKDVVQIRQLIDGFIATQAIAVAAKLGLADLIEEKPKSIDELSQVTESDAASLRRLVRMLTSIGIFREGNDGTIHQTGLSGVLRRDHPDSMRAFAIFNGSPLVWKPWGELGNAVITGKPSFDRVFGGPVFEFLTTHPGEARVFDDAMTSASAAQAMDVVAAYDFSHFEQIVDVGGGHGLLLRAILDAHPKLHGILADQPQVVAAAEVLRNSSVAARCEFAGVDFFGSVPDGADAYIMKWILHDWADESALKILKSCRRAIRSDGTLLVVDSVLKPPNESDPGKFMDLMMMVEVTGKERTEAEFAQLFREAGFGLTKVVPTAGALSIVEGRPV